jgi:ADP-heptose:LPS heptosyltransferase
MKVPFVAIFGPTDPKRHLPNAEKYELIYKKVSCSPCYKSECTSLKCLKSVTVEEVLKSLERLIKK